MQPITIHRPTKTMVLVITLIPTNLVVTLTNTPNSGLVEIEQLHQ